MISDCTWAGKLYKQNDGKTNKYFKSIISHHVNMIEKTWKKY